MTWFAARWPLVLDPLIAEAKRRARQRRLLVAAGACALLGVAAALALELPSRGGATRPGPAGETRSAGGLTVPKGTDGIAVIVYGRLSVATKSGFHIHGLPVGAASLSPHARYVAAGMGHSLIELAPSGRRLWSQPVGKPVVNCGACNAVAAIAWSPDGSRIAYLVRTPTMRQALHVIRRDGTHDTVIDVTAHGGQPSWRADSRALAYIGAHGRPTIYDLARRTRHVIALPIARSPAPQLAFAPRGGNLAISEETAVLLVGGGRDEVVWRGPVQEINWIGGRLAVSEDIPPSGRSETQLYTVTRVGARLSRTVHLPGPILAAHGRTIALPAGAGVVAGSISALRRVFRFTVKPPYHSSLCLCGQIAIGMHDISLG